MKKMLMIALALVMALTMVMGSVSAVSARPVDKGYSYFEALSFYDNSNRYWEIRCRDYYASALDETRIYKSYATDIPAIVNGIYPDAVTSRISFNKGTATFKNSEMEITLTFKRLGTTTGGGTKKSGDIWSEYNGGAVIKGNILGYAVEATVGSGVRIIEEHIVAK